MKICANCVLPESFPGIALNRDGVCQPCQRFGGRANLETRKRGYREKFAALTLDFKNKGPYDALVSFSGGKDSTYGLYLARREFGFKVLAVTFDNGFIPDRTLRNVQAVTDSLGVDHIYVRPPFEALRRLFAGCATDPVFPPATLTRASTICTACMSVVKFSMLRIAVERRVPFIVFGWSPGQIPLASSIVKNTGPMVRLRQQAVIRPMLELAGEEIRSCFLAESQLGREADLPYSISPLAFLDYDEKRILEEIGTLGWKAPTGVDANSTNCLLNSLANIIHKARHGFHPYSSELAKLVREGYMERSLALAKLGKAEDIETIRRVERKLGVKLDEILGQSSRGA